MTAAIVHQRGTSWWEICCWNICTSTIHSIISNNEKSLSVNTH